MNYNTISAQRIAGALGAEIASVDLSRPLSDEVIGEIRQALLDHQVIFFRDQHLTSEQHRWLRIEAVRLGITRAELLRRLIDKWRGAEERRDVGYQGLVSDR